MVFVALTAFLWTNDLICNYITLPMLRLNFRPKHKDATIFENRLNPVILVYFQMSTHLPVFQSFFRFFASFCIVQIATSSIRVKMALIVHSWCNQWAKSFTITEDT